MFEERSIYNTAIEEDARMMRFFDCNGLPREKAPNSCLNFFNERPLIQRHLIYAPQGMSYEKENSKQRKLLPLPLPLPLIPEERGDGQVFYAKLMQSITSNQVELVPKLLHSYSGQEETEYNWKLIYECILKSVHCRPICQELINYYQPKLPECFLKDVRPFVCHETNGLTGFQKHFYNVPKNELWRMFVDVSLQREENGWLDFEKREPGCIEAMFNSLNFIEKTITSPVSVQLIKDLHTSCTLGVQRLNTVNCGGVFREMKRCRFPLTFQYNMTVSGLIELLQTLGPSSLYHMLQDNFYYLHALPSDAIHHAMEEIIHAYHRYMRNAQTPIARLYGIIGFIAQLERLHPFSDANCRTFCIFLLNRELICNGFSPVMLENPNHFDGLSRSELFNEVVQGMENFQKVKMNNQHSFNFGLNNQQIAYLILTQPMYMSLQPLHRWIMGGGNFTTPLPIEHISKPSNFVLA